MEPVSADVILDVATRLIERDGVAAFTMRGLAAELGVAATSIYWHVGGRDRLLDSLVDRLLARMAELPIEGTTAVDRIASLARAQRTALIEQQHLLGVAQERGRARALFAPIRQTLAGQLAKLGVSGAQAALVLRAVEIHVISSALMQFTALRADKREEDSPSVWDADWPDRELVEALHSPTDYDAVFEYGLAALLETLRDGR